MSPAARGGLGGDKDVAHLAAHLSPADLDFGGQIKRERQRKQNKSRKIGARNEGERA